MSESRLLTPFENQGHNSYEGAESTLPRPSFLTRHSATPSGISIGEKLQRHLDAGMPLYIGLDPADPQNSNGCEKGGRTTSLKQKPPRKWLRVLTLGAPLDTAAKLILTTGMALALLALLWAVGGLIRMSALSPCLFCSVGVRSNIQINRLENHRLKNDFDLVMVIGQFIWGVFLGAPCIFGMELMWGKWRVC